MRQSNDKLKGTLFGHDSIFLFLEFGKTFFQMIFVALANVELSRAVEALEEQS